MDFDIEALSKSCDRASFSCSNEILNQFLKNYALQNHKSGLSKCFVALDKDRSKDKTEKRRIAGFYTLTADAITTEVYEAVTGNKYPYSKIPLALIGRLATDEEYEGHGVGLRLLIDAADRALRAEMGIYGLSVKAKDNKSQDFYIKNLFVLLDPQERELVFPFAFLPQLRSRLEKYK